MTYNTGFLLKRRTIRKYTREPVGDELLNDLLKEGCQIINYREHAGLQYYSDQG